MNWLMKYGIKSFGKQLLVCFIFLSNFSFAQTYADPERYLIDSLDLDELIDADRALLTEQLDVYHGTASDSIKVVALEVIIDKLRNECWIKYNKFFYTFNKKILKNPDLSPGQIRHHKLHLAGAVNNMGFAVNAEGNAFLAVDYYMQASKIFESIQDSNGMAMTYINAATAYNNAGEMELSNEMDLKGIEIGRDIGQMKILSVGYKNIAMKLFNAGHLDEALVNALTSLKYARLLPEDPVAEAVSLIGIGQIYSNMQNDSAASANFTKALEIKRMYATEASYVSSLEIYGEHLAKNLFQMSPEAPLYNEMKDSTLKILLASAEASKRLNQVNTLVRSYMELSKFYQAIGQSRKALKYADLAYDLAKETSNLTKKQKAAKIRANALEAVGNYKEALKMTQEHYAAMDKINYEAASEMAARNKIKLEHSVKVAQDSIKFESAHEISRKEIEFQQKQITSDKRQKWILYSGLFLIAIFSFFLFKKFKQTQVQNLLIEDQKSQIEEVHEEITSSIQYAKRLQSAILPPLKAIQSNFSDSFVLFQPKDIVSGDFYWFEQQGVTSYIAAADCTGHGVPGAMVSVVCSNALNQSLKEFNLTSPAAILNKTRELVIDTFSKSGADVKDGMDISLCAINSETKEIIFAGANNPLWLIKKEAPEVQEIKGDKQPIGLYAGMIPFKEHKISFETGDQIYLFTDGYPDQFGGEKGKKMKYKPFKEFLLNHQADSLKAQDEALQKNFSSWKGEMDQIDDVCIIGLKL